MNVTVGVAPDSWGIWFPEDPRQTPWQSCMDEMKEAGYDVIELGPYGYMPRQLTTLRSELDKRGVRKVTASAVQGALENPDAWPALEKELLVVGELLAGLGADYIVLIDVLYSDAATGKLLQPRALDTRGWKQLIETTHRAADLVRDRFGLALVFHPHAETHVEYEDQIEKFLEDTDPPRVALCFDTGHHAYRGGDPVEFMRKHHTRIPYLHLKSVDDQVRRKVEADHIPWGPAVAMDMFVEPSKGAVDFEAFRDVLRQVNYEGFAIVEQDMYPAPFDKPLPIAKRTRQYLRQIGLG
jgi:inosose dehydratase